MRRGLDSLIAAADVGEAVTVDDLQTALNTPSANLDGRLLIPPSPKPQPTSGAPRPPRDQTRDFGPRPGGGDEHQDDELSDKVSNRWVLLVAALVVIAAIALDFGPGLLGNPAPPDSLALENSSPSHNQTVSALSLSLIHISEPTRPY